MGSTALAAAVPYPCEATQSSCKGQRSTKRERKNKHIYILYIKKEEEEGIKNLLQGRNKVWHSHKMWSTWNIQTQKGWNECLLILTRTHSMHIFASSHSVSVLFIFTGNIITDRTGLFHHILVFILFQFYSFLPETSSQTGQVLSTTSLFSSAMLTLMLWFHGLFWFSTGHANSGCTMFVVPSIWRSRRSGMPLVGT